MLGYTRAGKTALLKKYLNNTFPSKYSPTQPMNLENKKMEVKGELLQVAIWDIGSQMGYGSLLPMYYRGSLGAVIVFDLTDRKSFHLIDGWVNELEKYCSHIPLMIVGNKKDLENRKVKQNEIDQLLMELRKRWREPIIYKETSAKGDRSEVATIFETLVSCILDKILLLEEYEDEEEDQITSI